MSKYPIRSLTFKEGWTEKKCLKKSCGKTFWVIPSKADTLAYCCDECRYDSPLEVIAKHTTKSADPNGCWICDLTPSSKYPCLKFKGEQLRASRIVLEAALGRPIAPGLLALHQCDNPRCVRVGPEHIFEGTQQTNIEGCVERGRHHNTQGERSTSAKLTADNVNEIRSLRWKESAKNLAARFGVDHNYIWHIWLGITWTHLPPCPPKPKDWVKSNRSKLKEEDIVLIFTRRAAKESVQSIADAFGVAFFTVQRILRRLIWKHVDIPKNILTKIPELE